MTVEEPVDPPQRKALVEITPLHQNDTPDVLDLMSQGRRFVTPRTSSDYWLYATLFSTTCPLARANGELIGAIIAFRSQDHPDDVYLQDVITHPAHRRTGVASALLDTVRNRGLELGARRLYLTSEPDNTAAHTLWTKRGFVNLPGDHAVDGVAVISDYKGPGKHRALYELRL